MPDHDVPHRDRPLSDLAQLDASYAPFAAFASWVATPLDRTLWGYWRDRLRDGRATASEETFARARERTFRMAAIDTGAIEGLYGTDRGFTMTVSAMADQWTLEVESQKGRNVRDSVAAQRAAFGLALDAVSGSHPLSEAWLRNIHEEICAPQDTYQVHTAAGPQRHPLPKGKYKTEPNHVQLTDGSQHAYAPVDRVRDEMYRLLTELRSPMFEGAHPAVQAAFAHHALTTIHPFADGNGRVARVLASVFLLKAESIPLVVFADQAAAYFDALEHADEGRHDRFVDFVFERALDTLALVADALLGDDGEEVAAAASSLMGTIGRAQAQGGADLRVAGHSVVGSAMRATRELLQRHVPDGMSVDMATFRTTPAAEMDGLHTAADSLGGYVVRLGGLDPVGVGLQVDVGLLVDVRSSAPFAFRLQCRQLADVRPLDVRLSEVHPRPTAPFAMRLSRWVERLVSAALAAVDLRVRQQLEPPGDVEGEESRRGPIPGM